MLSPIRIVVPILMGCFLFISPSAAEEAAKKSQAETGTRSEADPEGDPLESEITIASDDGLVHEESTPPAKTGNLAMADSPFPEVSPENGNSIGDLSGEHTVTEFTGDLRYTFPIRMPPGRNGLTPSVVLEYSSSNKNGRSIIGTGWGIEIPKIERYSRTGFEHLYTTPSFRSSLAGGKGELIVETVDASGQGTYQPKVWGGAYRHEYLEDRTWRVTDALGNTYIFGTDSVAREESSDGEKIHTWYLSTIEDTNGNRINYEYVKSQGAVYLTRIFYGESAAPYEVIFEPFFSGEIEQFDALPGYGKGFPIQEERDLLESISVVDSLTGDLLRYGFEYRDFGGLESEGQTFGAVTFLDKIMQKGISQGGTVAELPPIEFSYDSYRGERSLDVEIPNLDDGTGYYDSFFIYRNSVPQWIFGDYNGDGWDDIVTDIIRAERVDGSWNRSPYHRVFLSLGNGKWQEMESPEPSGLPWLIETRPGRVEDYYPPGFRDLDGDMYSHLCLRRYHGDIDRQDGMGCEEEPTIPIFPRDTDFRYLELNADGLPDLFVFQHKLNYYENRYNTLYKNDGTGYAIQADDWKIQEDLYYDEGTTLFVDLNLDGLDDLVHSFKNLDTEGATIEETKRVLLNTGTGWLDVTSQISIPEPLRLRKCQRSGHCYSEGLTRTFQTMDVNRDGRQDLIWEGKVYLNDGSGWGEVMFRIPFSFHWGALDYDANNLRTASFLDLNSDGVLDRRYDWLGDQTGKTWFYPNEIPDLPVLTSVSNTSGGQLRFEYTPASSYLNSDGSAANLGLPIPRLTLSKVTAEDGLGNMTITEYSYAGGKLYRPHVQQQEFLGFREVRQTLADGTVIDSEFLQGDSATNFASKGQLARRKTFSAEGPLLLEERNLYDVATRGNGSFQSLPAKNLMLSISPTDPTLVRATAVETAHDSYGNVIEIVDYGEVRLLGDSTEFTDVGQDKLTTTIEYASNEEAFIVSLPKKRTLQDFNGLIVGQTLTFYDGLSDGQVMKGNATREDRLVAAPASYVTTETAYNSVGLPERHTNERGFETIVSYDSRLLFPRSVINPKQQETSYEHDGLFGVATAVTDPNGAVTRTNLDPLGRVLQIWRSDPSSSTGYEVLATSFVYETTEVPHSVLRTEYTQNSGISIVSRTFYDGFQRLIQTRAEAEGSDRFNVANVIYDPRGNVQKELLPVFAQGADFEAVSPTALGTEYTHDALGRITSISAPTGTSTTAYDRWSETFTDANGHEKSFAFDARQNLREVTEYLDGSPFSTRYEYDALGNLSRIEDAVGNYRLLEHDLLGRKLLETDLLRPGSSPNRGWIFSYDASGNLTSRTDPKGQSVIYTFDELDRVLTEDFIGAPGLETVYVYDEGLHALGRLSRVTSASVAKSFVYDLLGRIVDETKNIDGAEYATSYSYDLRGNSLSLILPDGMVVEVSYNAAGLLESTSADGAPVVTNIDLSPNGLVEKVDLANGTTTVNTYDPQQSYRLTRKLTTGAAGEVLQDTTYGFDPVGNILSIEDSSATSAARTATYSYDDLDRLVEATVDSAEAGYSRSYAYDILGNLTSRSDVGAYTYDGDHPHAASQAGGRAYAYDLNGNLTSNDVQTFGWDYRDRLVSSGDGQASVIYGYDESGERVFKEDTTTGELSVYVNRFFEISGDEVRRHIYAGELKVATDLATKGSHILDPSCAPPSSSDWIVSESCTFNGSTAAPADVIVPPNVVLTVSSGAVLEINLREQRLLVEKDGGVLVKAGGVIRQGDGTTLPGSEPVYSGLVCHHADHLGGSSIETGAAGELLQVLDYYPYGSGRIDRQYGKYSNNFKFTGKELDAETNLYYYSARYYDPLLARFLSLDPWFGDMRDPQSLNKYAYVRNNPLKFVDPTGESFSSFFTELSAAPKNMFTVGKEIVRGIKEGPENFELSEAGREAVAASHRFSAEVEPVVKLGAVGAGSALGGWSVAGAGRALGLLELLEDAEVSTAFALGTIDKSELAARAKTRTVDFFTNRIKIPNRFSTSRIEIESVDGINLLRQETLGFAADLTFEPPSNQGYQKFTKEELRVRHRELVRKAKEKRKERNSEH